MKNKGTQEGLFQKRGFYIALYSCLGVVLVAAAVISFGNLRADKNPEENQMALEGELEAASSNTARSYLAPEDRENGLAIQVENSYLTNKDEEPEATEPEEPAMEDSGQSANDRQETPAPVEDQEQDTTGVNSEENKDEEQIQEAPEAEATFNAFEESLGMFWPVQGEIVMNYSMDHVIYDKTLDQYRTNDNICIAASVGTQVKAAADGKVKAVSKSAELGNTIVIDHGNGWETTYSQLQDNVLVREGDVVKKGQAIGGVGSPTNYSVLLGNHLAFKVTRNETVLDPSALLMD